MTVSTPCRQGGVPVPAVLPPPHPRRGHHLLLPGRHQGALEERQVSQSPDYLELSTIRASYHELYL